jgi:hypothetical protein
MYRILKIILFFFLFSIENKSYSQSIEETKYQIVSQVIDSFISKIDLYYYYQLQDEPQKIDENRFDIEKDTLTFINTDTYETITITNRESARKYNLEVISKRIKEYKKEKKLWENIKNLDKKRIYISSINKKDLTKFKDYERFPDNKQLLCKLHKSHTVSWDASKIKAREPFLIESKESRKELNFKYLTVAFIMISDVILNKEKTKAILQIYYHYGLGKSGKSGYGGIFIMKKNKNEWVRDKWLILGEE